MPRLGAISPELAFLLAASGVTFERIRAHRLAESAIDLCKPCAEALGVEDDPDSSIIQHEPYDDGIVPSGTRAQCAVCGKWLSDEDE